MSFPRYPEYKDSGVEWLGEVPAHWVIRPIKAFARFSGGGTPSRENPAYWGGTIPWVSPKDMKCERVEGAEESITEEGLAESSSSLVAAGRVLMVVRSGILKHTIPVAINDVPVALNQDMKAIELASADCMPSFLLRWVQGLNDRLLIAWAKQGATVESLEQAYMANSLVPLPSLEEQRTIETFLDRETAKIDALVAEQERLIALLKEKRQAVISHAVTKGLNPDAPMKDSGVDWLGCVPEAWTVTPLRYLVHSVGQGWSPQCESYAADLDSEYGVLKVGAVNGGVLDPYENKKLPPELEPPTDLAIRAGDLMISRANTRELVGRAAVADADHPRLLLCDKLYRLRFRRSSQLPKFIVRYLATPAIREQIELGASGASSSMLNISQSVILDLPVPVPPEDEMMTILEFCAQGAQQTSELIAQAEGAVDLLLERRAALISAAVTGQIDVRGLASAEAA